MSSQPSTFQECTHDARAILAGWLPPDSAQFATRTTFLEFIARQGDLSVDRDSREGHLTASTVLLDASAQQVLLTLHPLIGNWVQLGGHIEQGDATLAAAASREAFEESGIHNLALDPVPIGLDRHVVTCHDGHRHRSASVHLDVTFVATAPSDARHRRSDESLDLRWFDVTELPAGADATTRRLVASATQRMAQAANPLAD